PPTAVRIDLGPTNLKNANLTQAILENTDLERAIFQGARLNYAELTGSKNWTNQQFLEAKVLNGATMPDGSDFKDWFLNNTTKAQRIEFRQNIKKTISEYVKDVASDLSLDVRSVYAALRKELKINSYKDINEQQLSVALLFLERFKWRKSKKEDLISQQIIALKQKGDRE
ncbi:MAG: pentapeptide repeat-containing protein, partial [Chloroflexota bacterium]